MSPMINRLAGAFDDVDDLSNDGSRVVITWEFVLIMAHVLIVLLSLHGRTKLIKPQVREYSSRRRGLIIANEESKITTVHHEFSQAEEVQKRLSLL